MPAIGTQTGRSAAADKKIKAAARKRKVTAKSPPQKVKVQQAKAQAKTYGSQSKQLETQAKRQRKAAKKVKPKVRNEVSARDPFKAAKKSQRRAIRALAAHNAAHPKAAARLHAEANAKSAVEEALSHGKRELEGKGYIAKGLSALAEKRSGEYSKLAGPGTKGSPKMASAAPKVVKIGHNLAKDAITFPSQAIPSLYVPAAAAVEAAKGDTSRGKKLIEDVKQTDPVYNTVAAGVAKVRGDEKAAKSHIAKAKKSAEEHPGLTALEVAGVKGLAGRTTSRGLRAGGRTVRATGRAVGSKTVERAGEKVRRAGSTERAPRRVPGTNIVEERAYSRDSFTKAREVNKDRRARKRAAQKKEQAARARAKGHEKDARKLEQEAEHGTKVAGVRVLRGNPDRIPNRELRKQVDEDVQVNADIQQVHRGRTIKGMKKVIKRAGRGREALSVVAQRIARADKDDLRALVKEWEAEAPGLSHAKLVANQEARALVQKVIDDPKVNMANVEAAAKAFYDLTAPAQKRLGELEVVAPKQIQKAAVIPFAVRRMGGRGDRTPRLSATGVQKLVTKEERKAADKRVKKAQKGVAKARKNLAEAKAGARVSTARNKRSNTLNNAERELRAAQAELGRARRGEHAQARKVAVRRSKAERRAVQVERTFLRSDKKYAEIEQQLRAVNAEKAELRAEVQQGKGSTAELAAASQRSRQLAIDLEARANAIRSKPLIRAIKSGPRKGQKVITGRAVIKRAERREVAPKATMTKPADVIGRAKDRVTQAERAVATERKRIRGVAPKEHDRLLRAIEAHADAERLLTDARVAAFEARAAHIQAKKAGKGKKDRIIPGLVDEHGRPLTLKMIQHEMDEAGESPAAFVTQAPGRAVEPNVRAERAPSAGNTGPRTGAGVKQGTIDVSSKRMVESALRTQQLVDATEGFRNLMHGYLLRDGTGEVMRFKNGKLADQAADDYLFNADGSPKLDAVPMRKVGLVPIGGKRTTLENLVENVNKLTESQASSILESLKNAVSEEPTGDGPWGLMPEVMAQRIHEHLETMSAGGGLKALAVVQSQARKAVLATSTSWLAGNIVEASLRDAVMRAGPRSLLQGAFARKDIKALGGQAALDELMSRVLGGGQMVQANKAGLRGKNEQFKNTGMEGVADALTAFFEKPGPKQAAWLWNAYTDVVMKQLSGRIESTFQTAMLGKALRDSPLLDQHMIKLGKKARLEAAQGLINTPTMRRFGRLVDDAYGRYSKHPPWEKKAISYYTPFISWWLNSVNFVYRVLPRDHPVLTGLIASAEMATEDWRKDQGLDKWIENAVPGWLQGSIPMSGGRHQRAPFRYTPFAAFGDPGGVAAGQVNPLVSGILAALEGRDWTGRTLRVKGADGKMRPANDLERARFGAEAFLDVTIPFLSLGKRIADKGVIKAINPLEPVSPPKAKGSGGKIKRPGGFFGGSGSSTKKEGFFGGSSSGGSSGGGGSFFGN